MRVVYIFFITTRIASLAREHRDHRERKMKKILIIGLIMATFEMQAGHNLSHAKSTPSFQQTKEMLIQKIENRGDLSHVSVARQLEIVDQLSEFELGRF